MTGRLQATIKEYRQRLLAQERTAMAVLDYAHRQTLALIEPQLNALYDKMSAALANGEDISTSWLYEQQRLETITHYITNYIDHFAALSQMQVQQLQSVGASLGSQSGMALLNSTVPKGVSFSFGLPSPAAIANLVGSTQAGSPLSDLFNGFGPEAAQAAKNALISGVTLGYNPRQIASSIQDALNISLYRAQTIARTEMLRAYRDANTSTFQANSDVVDQWRWTCALSSRTCAACLSMDGELFPLDETLDSHPNCRCTPVPVTKSWADILGPLGIDTSNIPDTNTAGSMQTGSDWFDNQDADVQRAILGPGKYDAWANGDFTLDDIVGTTTDPVWGNSIYEKPLKELVK
jgi:SPP1 gp7 family putative phage head morphogenesis protein